MAKMVKRVKSIAYHRNGTCGTPFHFVRFESSGFAELIALVGPDRYDVRVVCEDSDQKFNGPAFEPELRAHIDSWETSRAAERMIASAVNLGSFGKGN